MAAIEVENDASIGLRTPRGPTTEQIAQWDRDYALKQQHERVLAFAALLVLVIAGIALVKLVKRGKREYVGAALLMLISGVFAYVVLDQIGAAVVCASCVGGSLIVAEKL